MVVNFVKKIKFILFLSIFFVLSFQIVNSKLDNGLLTEPIVTIEQDPKTQKLSFEISSKVKNEDYTQTLSYLSNDKLRKQVSEEYEFQSKFESLGKEAFSSFVVDPIKKEFELKDDYYVFYHGQKREFLLIQDLFARFNELVYKKALKDFVMLRIPDQDNKKFKNVNQFLSEYADEMKNCMGWFDLQSHVNKILLSVNPSLFGNVLSGGSCTFQYFLDSRSASLVDFFNLAKSVFENFNVNLNVKYEHQINELIELLAKYEKNKTGILLQIFVPKKIVDEISYRCLPGGKIYHNNKASKDLSKYQGKQYYDGLLAKYFINPLGSAKKYSKKGFYIGCGIPFQFVANFLLKSGCSDKFAMFISYHFLISLGWCFEDIATYFFDNGYKCLPELDADSMQFRILLDENIMLNPYGGVKIFRYCNETELVKEYKKKLDELFASISKDYLSFGGMAGA